MKTKALLLAAALSALSYSYCYSDTIAGTTNNAAANGLNWDMTTVLPPQAGLQIGGVIYRYTIEKDPNGNLRVHIQNENAIEGGYIFRETDDWSQLPGNTINKVIPLENIPREYFGNGSIELEGEGVLTNPNVQYAYKFDPCYIILTNPDCPGYAQALYDWLKEQGLLDGGLSPDDPYYDEWVQMMLDRETEVEEDEEKSHSRKEDEEDEEDPIEALNANVDIEGFVDGERQSAMISQLSTIPNFESYVTTNIPGGVYEDVLKLQDATLPDNGRALNNLARDELHREMIRSQYGN